LTKMMWTDTIIEQSDAVSGSSSSIERLAHIHGKSDRGTL